MNYALYTLAQQKLGGYPQAWIAFIGAILFAVGIRSGSRPLRALVLIVVGIALVICGFALLPAEDFSFGV